MFENVGAILQQLSDEKEISVDLLKEVIEHTMVQALKRKYGADINFHIEFDEKNDPVIYKGVVVVEKIENPNKEILLSEAKEIDENISLGEEVWLILDKVEEFARIESVIAKTAFFQKLSELEKNIIYNEFKRRENQLVNGYFQREYKGSIYVNLGKTEGILIKKDQSPREHYSQGDRIRAFIYSVKNDRSGHPSIFLTRTRPEFINKLFELEIPEIAEGIVEIKCIVRQPGLKTKVAVSSNKPEVDPSGACIGPKGVRIQSIIKEIEGEKIDIIKWSKDIREFIAKSVTPAKPSRVIITDVENRRAMVIVADDQLSFALGKGGYNIKMASQLTGYQLDVKTETDIKENPDILKDFVQLNQIFLDSEDGAENQIAETGDEGESNLYSLENVDDPLIKKLIEGGIDSIEDLYSLEKNDVISKTGISEDDAEKLMKILEESVEIVEDENIDSTKIEEEIVEEIEMYECPNCRAPITEDMTKCPKCGIEITFE